MQMDTKTIICTINAYMRPVYLLFIFCKRTSNDRSRPEAQWKLVSEHWHRENLPCLLRKGSYPHSHRPI